MKLIRDESGQMLIFTAVAMVALLGVLAFATDLGLLFHERRELQTAADAAATAGALNMSYGAAYTSAAKRAASANGVTDGTNGATVTINVPPVNGYHKGSGYVEAIVTAPNADFFMKVFGYGSTTVAARAVAGTPQAGSACVFVMDPTVSGALGVQGGYDIESPGCGLYVNSNSPTAFHVTGNGGTVNAGYLNIVGGANQTTSPTPPTTGVAPLSNPFGNTVDLGAANALATCATSTNITATKYSGTLDAGGGVECFSGKNVDISGATLSNGTFVFTNGVTAAGVGGNTTITNGTLEVADGSFTQNSNSNLNITAPTTIGQWNNGIAIVVPSTNLTYTPTNSNQLQVQFGSNNQTLDGYIYAPSAQLYLQDNGGGITAMGIVCDQLYDKSSTIRINSYNLANPNTTPLRVVTLVE